MRLMDRGWSALIAPFLLFAVHCSRANKAKCCLLVCLLELDCCLGTNRTAARTSSLPFNHCAAHYSVPHFANFLFANLKNDCPAEERVR